MSRWFPAVLLAGVWAIHGQDAKPQDDLKKQRPRPAVSEKEEIPPEEDASLAKIEFSFNPLQSKKDVQTGEFYLKKKSYLAAAGRFRDATKWDESNTDAWLLLGETEEKLKDHGAAKQAYQKYLELAGDAKNAAEIRKRLDKLK